YRYIRTPRDLAAYVYLDFTFQAFQTACLILFGMQGTTDIQRPYRGAPYDRNNPYRGNTSQSGFITHGGAHALDLVARASAAALRACWYEKWLVHRRMRPEEYGGRVHQTKSGAAKYPVHDALLSSPALDHVFRLHQSFLLPQGYPEGCPLHPSYPAGHAAVAGAGATVLKAFFDESFPVDDPVVASDDGLTLAPYNGPPLTIGDELNKLAWNVAVGRNMAGIHWRSDAVAGLKLGEAVALDLMREMKDCFNEPCAGWTVTTFDGQLVTI
ncbi:MAG TPA: phosphatase PAP2 family protein, partial [Thermoanaerobaculia bacterium]